MSNQKRVYRKRKRADQEAQTVLRITEAAVLLHGSLGPSRTSMSAVAKEAGVRRSTLYRHFPDEATLFRACTAHYMAMHPFPDLERWASIRDADQRLVTALRDLYALYASTAPMMENVHRDASTMPIVVEMLGGLRSYLNAAHATLLKGRREEDGANRMVSAAIAHALAFPTWLSLVQEQDLTTEESVGMMCRLAAAASGTADGPAGDTPRRLLGRKR